MYIQYIHTTFSVKVVNDKSGSIKKDGEDKSEREGEKRRMVMYMYVCMYIIQP